MKRNQHAETSFFLPTMKALVLILIGTAPEHCSCVSNLQLGASQVLEATSYISRLTIRNRKDQNQTSSTYLAYYDFKWKRVQEAESSFNKKCLFVIKYLDEPSIASSGHGIALKIDSWNCSPQVRLRNNSEYEVKLFDFAPSLKITRIKNMRAKLAFQASKIETGYYQNLTLQSTDPRFGGFFLEQTILLEINPLIEILEFVIILALILSYLSEIHKRISLFSPQQVNFY